MSCKETITAIVLLAILGASMHFVLHVSFFSHFLVYIFPVVESVMAHMKMVFYPMLLLSLYLVLSRHDIREFGAPILSGLTVVPVIVGAFFSYWIFVHHELMFLDIIIYLAAMVGAVLLARRWRQSRLVRKHWPLWIILVVVQLILTGYLTYNHPDWLVFANLG